MEIGKKNILSSQLLKKNIEKFNKRYIECKNIIRNNKIVDDSINNKINQNFIELPQIKNNLNIKTKKKFSSHKLLPKIFPYLKTKHKIFNK